MDDKAKKTFFEKIYNEIFPIVIKVSYHITKDMDAAQDVCQDAFIKLYHRVDTFPEVEDAKFWLIRVVKNLSFNYLEHEKVKNRAFDKIKHNPSFTDDTGEKQLLKKDAVEKVNLGHLEIRLFFGFDGFGNQSQFCHFLLAVRTGIHMRLDNLFLGILKLVIIE